MGIFGDDYKRKDTRRECIDKLREEHKDCYTSPATFCMCMGNPDFYSVSHAMIIRTPDEDTIHNQLLYLFPADNAEWVHISEDSVKMLKLITGLEWTIPRNTWFDDRHSYCTEAIADMITSLIFDPEWKTIGDAIVNQLPRSTEINVLRHEYSTTSLLGRPNTYIHVWDESFILDGDGMIKCYIGSASDYYGDTGDSTVIMECMKELIISCNGKEQNEFAKFWLSGTSYLGFDESYMIPTGDSGGSGESKEDD